MQNDIVYGVLVFTSIVLVLALFVMAARRLLVPHGSVKVSINGEAPVQGAVGGSLLDLLNRAGVKLPSACGGKGTCGLCKVQAPEAGPPLPTEMGRLSLREARSGTRLACQVKLQNDLAVQVPDEAFGVQVWTCRVLSVRNVATLIREIKLELPQGAKTPDRAGSFVQITSPPFSLAFSDFVIEDAYHDIWDKLGLWSLTVHSEVPVTRAYSIASYPGEPGIILLNVRIALPPPGQLDVPPGIVSSYLFGLSRGDSVKVAGPFGHFFVEDTDREMVFIGGGAGMAPMRAHIFDQLKRKQTRRKMTFWYGGRSKRELFYTEEFDQLAAGHDNFTWHVALSDPEPGDAWQGLTGFIHDAVRDQYLKNHPAPEDCEYYLCGPPMMLHAVMVMLDNLGVERDNIHFDDFGG
ncbi:MAG TPA: NADH:ubiquinone reductase (Na(+)-transporting) subunit F [Magnetovibrio sp.]